MQEKKSTYSKGLKGVLIFSGLQGYKMLLSVLTTKVSAVFLGPYGSGIYGLLTSTLTTIESFTGCGLGTSAVKDIAQANSKNDDGAVGRIYTVLNRWIWFTGIVGMLVGIVFSSYWSRLAFGNDSYAGWFIIISSTLLINQLVSGQGAFLTGLQKYKLIARLRMLGGLTACVCTIVCYVLWGIKGILPVIILTSLVHLIFSYINTRRVGIRKVKISFKETFRLGIPMFRMGLSLGISYALMSLSGYVLRVYIANISDIATVGLFTASFSLVNTYLGLVFSAIESDYYPRLSSCASDRQQFCTTMVQEIELLVFLIVPIVAVMMVFSQPVLAVLYSSKFYGAKSIICWSALSMLFKVPGWAMSIGVISLGRTKVYMTSQLIFIAYQLGLNILGFKLYGLLGVGVTYVIGQILYSVQYYFIMRKLSDVRFDSSHMVIGVLLFPVMILLATFATMTSGYLLYGVGSAVVVALCFICYRELDKRMDIRSKILGKLKKRTSN